LVNIVGQLAVYNPSECISLWWHRTKIY